jgi:hypothetical protein
MPLFRIWIAPGIIQIVSALIVLTFEMGNVNEYLSWSRFPASGEIAVEFKARC